MNNGVLGDFGGWEVYDSAADVSLVDHYLLNDIVGSEIYIWAHFDKMADENFLTSKKVSEEVVEEVELWKQKNSVPTRTTRIQYAYLLI